MTDYVLMLQIYEYIREQIEENGIPPTMNEIGDACHVSRPTAVKYVEILVGRNHLIRIPNKRRGLRLCPENPYRLPEEHAVGDVMDERD
ncbi:MAG: hypothetical protein D6737_00135 [Chloroflexi bacterium]|nr:MAG: hypothetical protein D6737_00135 [Chloroflexota bacterium]